MRKVSGGLTSSFLLFAAIVIVFVGPLAVPTEASEESSSPTFSIYLPAIFKPLTCNSKPTLISPTNGSSLTTLIPLFTLDPTGNPDATLVGIQISQDPAFSTNLLTIYAGIYNPLELRWHSNFDPATNYYWRAWHLCGNVNGPYTNVWTFTTGSGGTILPAPSLISPNDGVTLPTLPQTFQWSNISGGIEYSIHFSEVGSFTSLIIFTPNTQIDFGFFDPDTEYEWWVSARNDYAWGADSSHWVFTTPSMTGSPSEAPGYTGSMFVDINGMVKTVDQVDLVDIFNSPDRHNLNLRSGVSE